MFGAFVIGYIAGAVVMALARASSKAAMCEECDRPQMCAEPGCKRVAVQCGHWCIEHIGPHL